MTTETVITDEIVSRLLETLKDNMYSKGGYLSDILSIGPGAFLIRSKASVEQAKTYFYGLIKRESFHDVLTALIDNKETGEAIFKFKHIEKSIFIEKGEIVFAKSNQIDDRLGEILYRRGYLSINDLVTSRIKVTKNKRFGKILIEQGILNCHQLWEAIRLQISELIHSIFFLEQAEFYFASDDYYSGTKVVFNMPSRLFFKECANKGKSISRFHMEVPDDSVFILQEKYDPNQCTDFENEFIDIIQRGPSKKEILSNTKLKTPYAIATLLNLLNRKLLHCEEWQTWIEEERRDEPLESKAKQLIKKKVALLSILHKFITEKDEQFLEKIECLFIDNQNVQDFFGDQDYIHTGTLDKDLLLDRFLEKYQDRPDPLAFLEHIFDETKVFMLFFARDYMKQEDYKEISTLLEELEETNG